MNKVTKKYIKTEKGKATRKRYAQSKKNKIAQEIYNQTEKGKVVSQAALKRFRVNHPNQIKAVSAVSHAIRDGKLISFKFLLCHYCPNPAQQYHHWHGYEPKHWLDVIPVCVKCHGEHKRRIA